jgi:hypothetical protein
MRTAHLGVTPSALTAWLELRGWRQERLKTYASIWSKDDVEILVPNDTTTADYQIRVRDAVEDLARSEDTSVDDLALEISLGASDVISWRFYGEETRGGLIPLGNAAEYVANIKRAFVAAASSAVFRRAFFGRRVPISARLLAEDVQLAPTRPGSYIFPTSLQLDAPNADPNELAGAMPGYEPYERRTALSLAAGVSAVRSAIAAQRSPTAADTVGLASRGVSYELCAALAGLVGESLSVELTFKWSTTVDLRVDPPRQIRLKSSEAAEVRSLANLMYGSASTGTQTFTALVTTLHQDDPRAANGGSVRMRTVGRRESQLLLADLVEAFYRVALRAHEMRTPIEVDGRLVETPGHRSRIEDITDIRIASQSSIDFGAI